ncbi:hemin ABC transporter substrate-binding protein [Pigmentiphaga litoralis]|uniref:heme/hemin ABC transporter substrate-binding protein n=1 Tax=Pigmentiphaga litoralis TaxID=516702 RepID=UPI0016784245|nr:ABC transporter substrate-binding protein [Pigmentiphaga litoralis]GGX08259.1 hemin ABC transporter substrate-binding protein [Pigmentiphaga litoralis]
MLALALPGAALLSRVLPALAAAGVLPMSAAQAATTAASPSAGPVTAPAARPRLVSVGAGTTEIVYALGAQTQLVGVDTSSLYPAVAQALPKVGYQRTLTAEGVMSLAPQVLLASQDAGPPAVLAQIAAAGVTVVRVDGAYSFEGLLQRIGQVAHATGRLDEGEKLSVSLAARWADVMAQVDARPLRTSSGTLATVAFLMRHGPTVMAAGRGTGADAILRLAGARNAFGNAFDNYKPLSAEALAQAAPDVIIGTYDGTLRPGDTEALKALPGVALTPAGRSGAMRSFDIVLLLGFGPRLPDAVEALHQGLLQAVR